MQMPTQAELQTLLDYNPLTGEPVMITQEDIDAIHLSFAGQRVTLSDPIQERQAITLGRGEYREVAQ